MSPVDQSHDSQLDGVLLDEARIAAEVGRLARLIDADYAGRDGQFVLLGVLKGSLFFLADLSRRLRTPHAIETIAARSYYASTRSSGRVEIAEAPGLQLAGKDVLIVEDIYDTGRTLARLLERLAGCGARSVEVCALLIKAKAKDVGVAIKYPGVEIPDRFVVGYGLDCNERFRHLPYVALLRETPA